LVTSAHERHTVQIYETDGYLARRIVDFVGAGLRAGERCIVVATRTHREIVQAGLETEGIDVGHALASGDLVMLDARDTLANFMIADVPDSVRFELSVGAAISRATRDGKHVRAFGEMVDLLWRDGLPEAALTLERLWNELATKYDFDLLCAYTMSNLYKTSSSRFHAVCDLHDHVHPLEHSNTESTDSARLLVAEIARRAEVERELRETIRALQRAEDLERLRATRAAKLQQATAALASVVSLGELVDTILSTSTQLTGAISAGAYLVDSEGRFRIAGQDYLPSLPARMQVMPLDDDRPITHTLRTGEPMWLEKREQLFAQFPSFTAEQLDQRIHAVVTLPFVHRDKVIGGLGLAFETQRTFLEEERTWLLGFAAQCALAIERVQHYSAEHKARSDAENLLRIAESLNAMHLDLEAVLQKVTDEAAALVGAQYGAFVYSALTTVTSRDTRVRLGLPRPMPQAPERTEQPSRLAIPVRSRSGDVIGALFLGHDEPAKFTVQHEAVLRSLAVTAAIAIDNAELYQAARNAEASQRRSVEQLVDTVRINELFTGVLAHDLRSPIAAVTTAAELLMTRSGEYETKVLSRVLGSARRMARMIEQLLDFTRMRVGSGLPLDSKPCDLHALLAHVVDEQRAAHRNQAIELAVTGDPNGQWDDDRLAQALVNLIGNAAQHGTADEGVTVHLDGTDPAVVRVNVHNGGAIPQDLLPRIFEPMIGGQRRRDGTRGLGLGLYITREIASAHGGIVVVESSPEAGTTFTLRLPREVRSVDVERIPDPDPEPIHDSGFDIGQRARMLVDGAREHAIFLLDQHGNVQTWNETAERITGYSRADAMNRPFEIDLARATKLGFSEEEMWRTRRDGTRYWALVSVSAIRSTSSDLAGFTVILRDITEQYEARKQLEENEARMRLMIDSVRDYAIFLLDTEGKVASWNRGAQIAKGYTAGEIIGRHVSTFYTREDREAGRAQALLARAAEEGRIEDVGWRVRKDGSRFWADVVITALRDEHGELRGFTKVTRDLTERRRAEEELRRSEERFRLLVDTVKDYAIFMLDPTGHVMTWNAGAEQFKGYKASEIVGEHFSKFYDPEEVRAGKCERELELAVRDGRFEEEGWRIRKDGTRFWASVVITTLRAQNGQVVGFAKITRDLTERKTLEEQRLRTIQAQEGIRLRDEFLSIVSHELKTPLAGLLLQIDAIALRGLDETTRLKIARARESGLRLDRVIETLLDVSRIATGRFVLNLETFDLVGLISGTIDSFVPAAAKAGSEIRAELPEKLVGTWDRVRLTQVIANLLANAIKYGHGAPVEVRVEQTDNDVVIAMRDHGPGVDPTMQSRIFERFERAASTWHYGGFGIGLYVVREIVLAHGGRVSVENSPEGGARFTVRLPMETTA
jgi:PAS domain S-box-containing protein